MPIRKNRTSDDTIHSDDERGFSMELSRSQKAVAQTVSWSKKEIPHFYLTIEIDMNSAVALHQKLKQSLDETRVTINDMIVTAVAKSLAKYPALNASYQEGKLRRVSSINISLVVPLEDGLMVPAILDCGKKSIFQIARESKGLIERARKGVLKVSELTGGTFTVSNLGMYDIDSFSAIIFPPQSAILAVGNIREVPVVRDGRITISKVMKVTLSIDHRVAYGVQGAELLRELRVLLEEPSCLLPEEL
jgi:pyruvate dehydrogenase E2 component (dihydrolipoamide acetyltransferase)